MDEDLSISRIPQEQYSSSEEDTQQNDSELLKAVDNKSLSLSLIDYERLTRIKKDFKLKEEGLLKKEFITVMLHHLPEVSDKLSLVQYLNDLFAEIDVNDDKHLEWDEFLSHIIEIGRVKNDQGFVDVIKNYKQSDWKDNVKHESEIECMKYIPKLKHMVITEHESKRVKIYNIKTGRLQKEIKNHIMDVISIHHLASYSTLLCATNDLWVYFWDDTTYLLKFKVKSPMLVFTMNDFKDRLYIGGPNGSLYFWELTDLIKRHKRTDATPFRRTKKEGHTHSISAIVGIPELSLLATGDIHGKLFLWDVPSHSLNRKMKELNKGIYCLDWNPSVGCLFSAGLDRSAYVWNPYVSKYIYKLSGHIHSCIGVRCIPDSFQIVTADISGMFKIWDVRTFNCIQTFKSAVGELKCFEVTYPEKRIIAGGKKLYQYTYEEPKDINKVGEEPCFKCLYNTQYNCFVTAHASCIKIWDAVNGCVTGVLRDLCDGEITSIQFDNKERRMFLGDSQGNIGAYKVQNGARIKEYISHKDEINMLEFWDDYKFLISCGWDGRVKLHDDSRSDEIGVLRYDNIEHEDSVTCIDIQTKDKYLACAGDDRMITVFNLRSLRHEAELTDHEAEIKSIRFLNPFPCIVSSDLSGYLYFWAVPPSKRKNTLLLKVGNIVPSEISDHDLSPVRSILWDKNCRRILTGDDNGFIKIWEVDSFTGKLEKLGKNNETAHEIQKNLNKLLMTSLVHQYSSAFVQEDVTIREAWEAHNDGIISLSLIEDSEMLISTGFDFRTHIWNYSGERLGTLIVGGDTRWKVSIDVSHKLETEKKEASKLLDESMDISYEQLIEDLTLNAEIEDSSSSSSEEEDNFLPNLKVPYKERSRSVAKKRTSPGSKANASFSLGQRSRHFTAPKNQLSRAGQNLLRN